jgi:hypothetical protein
MLQQTDSRLTANYNTTPTGREFDRLKKFPFSPGGGGMSLNMNPRGKLESRRGDSD